MLILTERRLVMLQIYYYMPDFQNLVQEFSWTLHDQIPDLPRVHKFLTHWQRNIDAIIKEVLIGNAGNAQPKWRNGVIFPLTNV